jgi:hypothetical protein
MFNTLLLCQFIKFAWHKNEEGQILAETSNSTIYAKEVWKWVKEENVDAVQVELHFTINIYNPSNCSLYLKNLYHLVYNI